MNTKESLEDFKLRVELKVLYLLKTNTPSNAYRISEIKYACVICDQDVDEMRFWSSVTRRLNNKLNWLKANEY